MRAEDDAWRAADCRRKAGGMKLRVANRVAIILAVRGREREGGQPPKPKLDRKSVV